MAKKQLKTCKTNGTLKRAGKYFGICAHAGFGDPTPCTAHGNTKCEHMVKHKQGEG